MVPLTIVLASVLQPRGHLTACSAQHGAVIKQRSSSCQHRIAAWPVSSHAVLAGVQAPLSTLTVRVQCSAPPEAGAAVAPHEE